MSAGEQEGSTEPRLTEIRDTLDRAIRKVRLIVDPELPVRAAEQALGQALEHVYGALAALGNHATYRDESALALEDVRLALSYLMAAPSDDPAAQAVAGDIAQCLGALQHVAWVLVDGLQLPTEDSARPDVRASMVEPRLLDLQRKVLRPAIPIQEPPLVIAEPEPEPDVAPPSLSLAELLQKAAEAAARLAEFEAGQDDDAASDEEAPPPVVLTFEEQELIDERFGVAITDEQLIIERAQDCMDDLAMMGRMRRCTDPEPWASGFNTEQRMLTKVDAIAACGVQVFPELVRMLDDRPLPDPDLTYGNLHFFLCIAGDDSFDQALRLLEVTDLAESDMVEMCIDAFVFGCHPRIIETAAGWLSHPDPTWRYLGVEVLRRRRVLTLEQLNTMGEDPDERVLAALALALHSLPNRPPPGVLTWFLQRESERVVRAALESAMFLRDPHGYSRAVHITNTGDGAWAEAAMFVAIAGEREARDVLLDEVAADGSPVALRAAGWYGDIFFVPFLLGRLRDGDDADKAAALDALERLTGAGIIDAGLVPEYEPKDEPFLRERRDYEPPGLLDGDADAWENWWKTWSPNAEPGLRYRWGRPFRMSDLPLELCGEAFLQRDRPYAMMELSVRQGAIGLPDYRDLVVRQRRALGTGGMA